MSVVFSDLTAADWAEFEQHAPAACAWLQARAVEREYARLMVCRFRTPWQARRLKELHQLAATGVLIPGHPDAHPPTQGAIHG